MSTHLVRGVDEILKPLGDFARALRQQLLAIRLIAGDQFLLLIDLSTDCRDLARLIELDADLLRYVRQGLFFSNACVAKLACAQL